MWFKKYKVLQRSCGDRGSKILMFGKQKDFAGVQQATNAFQKLKQKEF